MSEQAPISVGLIGLGRHGVRYARHLLADVPAARLTAIAREHPERSLPFPAPQHLAVYKESSQLISDLRVQAIIAVTPPALFPRICEEAALARKPLLVEKPIAVTGSLAAAMVETMRRASTPMMVAHTLRFDRTLRGFRTFLPTVGTLRRLTLTLAVPARPRPPGNPGFLGRGPLLDLGVHILDLVRWLTGAEVRLVFCRLDPADASQIEEAAEVHLTLTTGCRCTVHVGSRGAERIGTAIADGDRGQATVDWHAKTLVYAPLSGSCGAIVRQSFDETATILETLQEFLAAVQNGAPMPVSATDGLEAVRLVDACYESARRREPLDVLVAPA